MRSSAAVGLCLVLVSGCLPAFAPNVRAREVHAGLRADTEAPTCLGCHPSEVQARAMDAPSEAPIVAQWMLQDARGCTDCHRVKRTHPRGGMPSANFLPSLVPAHG